MAAATLNKYLTRAQVIELFSGQPLFNKDIQAVKNRQLAHVFLANISLNRREIFTSLEVQEMHKIFLIWSGDYSKKNQEALFMHAPKVEGMSEKSSFTHNITSLPSQWTVGKFWYPSVKEQDNIEEKCKIQENLSQIGKASFEVEGSCAQDIRDIKYIATVEQLARGWAYKTPRNQETLEIYSPAAKSMVTYEVELISMGLGIKAFGLTSKNLEAEPILVFRGTSFYPSGSAAAATVVTDFDYRGIGYGTYQEGAQEISAWIEKAVETSGKKVVMTGHSLGSAFATYAAIDNYEKVDVTYGFGSTKVSALYYSKWTKLQDEKKAPLILNFNAPGDSLTSFGDVRLATKVFEGTIEGFLPSVEITGVEEEQSKRKLSIFTQFLNSVRPNSTAHRVCLFDKAVTLREVEKERPNWFTVAFRVSFFVPIYFSSLAVLKTYHCFQKMTGSLSFQ